MTRVMSSTYSKLFIRKSENEFELKIKKERGHNGSEFRNSWIVELFDDMGIKHEFLANYTQQPNALVESKTRTLIDMARPMLSEYMMLFGWKQSTRHVMHASNRLFVTRRWKIYRMSYWLEQSQMLHILESLVVNDTFSTKAQDKSNSRRNVTRDFYSDNRHQIKHIEPKTKCMA